MVKKGGTKRKIPMEKIEKKTSRGPCYSKRCKGLFGKASQLCLLSGAQIAVLATPLSENSNVSFYSFGHSSVDAIVSAFLSGSRPLVPSENNKRMREDIGVCFTRKALGLGFWWEDEAVTKSQDPQELKDAVDTISMLLKDVKKLNKGDQTLVSTPEVCCFSEEFLQKHDTQIMSHSEDFYNADNIDTLPDDIEMDFDQLINFKSDHLVSKELDQTLITTPEVYCISYDFLQNMPNSEDCYITDNNNDALPVDIEMDFDQLIDYETTSESLLPYHGLIKTSFESLVSNGGFLSTLELQEFAASPLTTVNTTDPTMSSDSQPVKDGNLVLQEIVSSPLTMVYEPVKDGDLVRKEFPASPLASSDSHDSIDPSMFSDGDLVLHEFVNDSMDPTRFSDSDPVEDGDLVLQEFAASLLTSSDSHDSMDQSMFYEYQPVKDGDLMLQNRCFNDDDLHFSDVFNELSTITTL